MNDKTHATLSASASNRWLNCPGSIRMSALFPQPKGSIYAQEGTAAHTLAETCLTNKDGIASPEDFRGDVYDGHFIDTDMIDAVQVYVDEVKRILEENPGSRLMVETKFDLSWLYPGLFGTNDCAIFCPLESKLYVIDYKHGRGHSVTAKDNSQLAYYSIGAVAMLEKNQSVQVSEIEMIIVQPRAPHADGPIRRWAVNRQTLNEWADKIVTAAKACDEPDAPTVAGDWCKWCPASGACDSLHTKALTAAQAVFSDKSIKLPDPTSLDESKLITVLNHSELISNWLKSVEAHAIRKLEGGGKIEGFKLVEGRSNRIWKNEADVVAKFDKDFEIWSEPKLLSPAQLEKVIGKKMIEPFTTKPEGKTTLVPEHDKRPAKKPVFTEINNDLF